jgi:hypothetical protein
MSFMGAVAFAAGGGKARRRVWVAVLATGAVAISVISTSAVAKAAVSPMAAGIAVFPATLTFPTQTVGTATPPMVVAITNIGADPLTLVSIVASAGDFTATNACGTSLSAGASCGVAVTFAPTATGTRTATLTITDNAAGSPHTVQLTGTGQAAPSTSGPTPPGTYNITVSGTSNTLVQSGQVVLTVQ